MVSMSNQHLHLKHSSSNEHHPTNTIQPSHSLYHMKFDWILGQLMRRFCNLLIRRLTLQDQLRICFNNCSSIKHLNLSKRVEFHVNGVNMTHVRFMARQYTNSCCSYSIVENITCAKDYCCYAKIAHDCSCNPSCSRLFGGAMILEANNYTTHLGYLTKAKHVTISRNYHVSIMHSIQLYHTTMIS